MLVSMFESWVLNGSFFSLGRYVNELNQIIIFFEGRSADLHTPIHSPLNVSFFHDHSPPGTGSRVVARYCDVIEFIREKSLETRLWSSLLVAVQSYLDCAGFHYYLISFFLAFGKSTEPWLVQKQKYNVGVKVFNS